MDLKSQLDNLRSSLARSKQTAAGSERDIKQFVAGTAISNSCGSCFQSNTEYPENHRQGEVSIVQFKNMDPCILHVLGKDARLSSVPTDRLLFLDTETTGIAGGTGTVAFLVGLGYFTETGFRIEQYFMRDYNEEPALLCAIKERLDEFNGIVSYNGKAFDMNLLVSRFILSRMDPPDPHIPHLDLLFTVRRLWRRRLSDCSLVNVERSVLGFNRENDVPGFLIPGLYFDYLRTGNGKSMEAVFNHNRWDILTLAATAGLTGHIYLGSGDTLRHPADLLSLARAFMALNLYNEAVGCLKRIECSEDQGTGYEAQDLLGYAFKRLGRWEQAADVWTRMLLRPLSIKPFEELAKYLEHRVRAPADAMKVVEKAFQYLEIGETLYGAASEQSRRNLLHRYERLKRKMK